MEQALEAALECADDLIENAQQRPPTMECLSSERKSLFQKLHDLYVEECEKEPVDVQELRTNVNLLEKLVMRERLSHLVVSLYPGSEGYSLMLSGENKSESETIKLPYEEREFLEYLDAEELPPLLVEYLEKSQVNMFYSGCVIAEVRDYRQCSNTQSPGYQSRHVLLRPTMQTLAQDVHSITNEDSNWTEEDKLALESQLILATAEPLCLDPSVAVTCTANRLLYEKQKMNTHPMKQCFKRCFRSSLNQQPELSDDPPPSPLTPFTSCQERKKRKANQQHDLKISQAGNCVDMWKQSPCDLAMPSRVDVEKHTKMEKFVIPDDSRPIVWAACEKNDDDFLERGAGHQHWTASLAAMQSRDPVLSETIQPCEDDEENDIERSPFLFSIDDHPDLFITGPKAAAETVVSQNQDLVQKEAKCPERISHSSTGSASLSQRSLREEVEQPQTGLVPSSVLSKEVKHLLPPAKLPSSLETSSSVNLSTPQQGRSFLKSPTPSPASKPPVPCQKSSVDLSRVSTLSAAAPSPASSSQRPMVVANTATLKSIDAMGSGHGAEASVSGSKPTLACSPSAKTPAEVNPNGCVPSRVPVPAAVPDAVQAASEAGVSRKINMISFVGPLTLVHLPDGQFFLILQQQKKKQQQQHQQQEQQQQQHHIFSFTLKQPPRKPGTLPHQPGGQDSAKHSVILPQCPQFIPLNQPQHPPAHPQKPRGQGSIIQQHAKLTPQLRVLPMTCPQKPRGRGSVQHSVTLQQHSQFPAQPQQCPRCTAQPQQRPAFPAQPQQRSEFPAQPQQRPAFTAQPQQRPAFPAQPQQRPEFTAQPQQRSEFPAQPQQRPAFPAQPQQRSEFPAQPQQRPAFPAQPQQRPEFTAQPQQRSEFTAQPQQRPGFTAQPQQRPEFTAQPQQRPEFTAQPQQRSEFTAQPQQRPGFTAQPQQRPEFTAQPQQRPEFTAQPQQRSEFTAQPQQRPAFPAQPQQRPEFTAQPQQRPAFPAQPQQRPAFPAQPQQRPAFPAQPQQRPEFTAQPQQRPEFTAQPQQRSEFTAQPQQRPGFTAQPQQRPAFTAQPQRRSEFTAQPQQRPEFTAQPQQRSEFTAQPQQRPGFTAQPQQRPAFTAQPQRRSEFTAQPQQRPGFTAQPQRRSEFTAQPQQRPGFTAQPQRRPAFTAQPQRRSEFTAQPQRRPAFTAQPQRRSEFTAQPQQRPGFTAQPQRRSEFTAQPQRRPGFTAQPQRRPGFTAQPQRRPGYTAQPQRRPGFTAQPQRRPRFTAQLHQHPPSHHQKPGGQGFAPGSIILQQRSKSTPQQPAQHLPADPQQPGGQGSAQGSTSQAQAFTIEQALLNNLPKLQHVVPAQTVVLPQLPSVQKKPQRSLPQQRVQIPTDIPQQKPHIQLLKTLQRPVFVTEADKEAGQPRCHQGTGSQSAGKMKTGTATMPNPES